MIAMQWYKNCVKDRAGEQDQEILALSSEYDVSVLSWSYMQDRFHFNSEVALSTVRSAKLRASLGKLQLPTNVIPES